jgi:hypothetical protein
MITDPLGVFRELLDQEYQYIGSPRATKEMDEKILRIVDGKVVFDDN